MVSGCEEMYQRVEDLKNRTDEYFSFASGIQDVAKEINSELEEPKIDTQTFFAQLSNYRSSRE